MITLYAFGPYFGLPDASPFCIKAETLLKMAKLPYAKDLRGFAKAPKGKQPYIRDDGTVVADSTFIRDHIEAKYGIDFDQGLTAEQRATCWALERMCEERLYWAIVDARWLDETNFAKGPARFFDRVPAPLRPAIRNIARRRVRKYLHFHGLGRHSADEVLSLAKRDIDAIATLLGGKPYLMGDNSCGADATIFAFVLCALCPHFDTELVDAVTRHASLVAYCDRMMKTYFADYARPLPVAA
jgi:glutathione S-transferase